MTTLHELSRKVEEHTLAAIEQRAALEKQTQALDPARGPWGGLLRHCPWPG